MQKKYFIAGATVLALGLLGGFLLWQRQEPTQTAVKEIQDSAPQPEAEEPPYAVSLPALMAKEFQGGDLSLGRVLDDNSAYTRYSITYKSGLLSISGILNVPKGTPPPGGFPVLVLNHGYIDPAIYTNGRGLKREQDFFARQGFAVLHPDFRNHASSDKDPQADTDMRLGYAEDAINAVYAVKNSGLNFLHKENIGMLGHSMGGGVTLNVLVAKPGLVKAAVLFAPVNADAKENFERWLTRRPQVAQRVIETHGSFETNPEFWQQVSAQTYLDKIQAPIQLHHGTADQDVPYEWSVELAKNLEGQGREIEFLSYENQPHEFTSDWAEVVTKAAEFYRQHLK